ncbi:aldo-keto reductase family protein [Lacticaseibacillus hegangensis]|uniref:Aldo/keto reductase n=1 Tax=Lacticaseibacillus hegangensis TaxID=2486010 RepID=A0ABW4CRY9_9LACO|nr:aldo/keto reductase [Lacticaseibacillus hegangensis]
MSHLTKLSDTVALTDAVAMPEVGVVVDKAPENLAEAALKAGFRHLICNQANLPVVQAAIAQSGLPADASFVTVRLAAGEQLALAAPVALIVAGSDDASRQAATQAVATGQAQAKAVSGEMAPDAMLVVLPVGVTQQREAVKAAKAAGLKVASDLPFGEGDLALLRPLRRMAERYGKTPQQVVIRWLLQSGVWPWLPATTAEEVTEWGAVFDFELSFHDTQVLAALDGRPMAPRKHRRH